jgi:hypothetical protein
VEAYLSFRGYGVLVRVGVTLVGWEGVRLDEMICVGMPHRGL